MITMCELYTNAQKQLKFDANMTQFSQITSFTPHVGTKTPINIAYRLNTVTAHEQRTTFAKNTETTAFYFCIEYHRAFP